MPVAAIVFGAALCGLLNAWSEGEVAVALIVAGFLGGVVDVTMNAEGARIERRLGRPILARLHAAASAGMAIGAILGSLIAAGSAPWAAGILAAIALAGAGVAYDRAARSDRPVPAPVGASGRSGSRSPRPDRARRRHRRLDRGGNGGVAVVDAPLA